MRIEKHIVEQDKIEITTQKQVDKQHKLLASIRPKKGHTLFEINLMLGSVEIAEFETITANFKDAVTGRYGERKKVLAKKGCFYISALNKKNAIRQLKKEFFKQEQAMVSDKN